MKPAPLSPLIHTVLTRMFSSVPGWDQTLLSSLASAKEPAPETHPPHQSLFIPSSPVSSQYLDSETIPVICLLVLFLCHPMNSWNPQPRLEGIYFEKQPVLVTELARRGRKLRCRAAVTPAWHMAGQCRLQSKALRPFLSPCCTMPGNQPRFLEQN